MRPGTIALACATTLATVAVAAPAVAAPPDTTLTLPQPAPAPKHQAPLAVDAHLRTGADCQNVRAELPRYAARGIQRIGCTTVTTDHPDPTTSTGVHALATWCDGLDAGQWWVTRTEACIHGLTIIYTVIAIPSGLPVGTATFSVSQEIELSTTTTQLSEDSAVTLAEASGELAAPRASFAAACTAPCVTTDGAGFTETMTLLETEDAFFTYTDNPGTNGVHNFITTYTFNVAPPPNTTPAPPVTWSLPTTLRCDSQVGNFPGCVVPFVTPELVVSLTTHRAAAANILFAQTSLPDGWGSTQPLTRQANTATADANRRAICEDGTWVPDPTISQDSCDEYAFAASRQSGAAFGLRGIDCAEVTPVQGRLGRWSIVLNRYTGTERCVRGHVPLPENSLVGTALSNLTQGQRILDAEAYFVTVVA